MKKWKVCGPYTKKREIRVEQRSSAILSTHNWKVKDKYKNAFKFSTSGEVQWQRIHTSCRLWVNKRKHRAMPLCIRLAERRSKCLEHMSNIQDGVGLCIFSETEYPGWGFYFYLFSTFRKNKQIKIQVRWQSIPSSFFPVPICNEMWIAKLNIRRYINK